MVSPLKAALTSIALTLLVGCSQSEAPPCGPASLVVLGKAFGLSSADQEALTRAATRSPRMTSFAELTRIAAGVHLTATGFQLTPAELYLRQPKGILELNNGHFVALLGFRNDLPVIADPKRVGDDETSEWSRARLENHWTGRILVISR